jgi:hypothetical protein
MMLKKMVTDGGSIYYVMFENGFDDDTLIVYTEKKMKEMADAEVKRSLESPERMGRKPDELLDM